jgi:hypothetical protein
MSLSLTCRMIKTNNYDFKGASNSVFNKNKILEAKFLH